MKFYHTYRFVWPSPHSGDRRVQSEGSLVLSFFSRISPPTSHYHHTAICSPSPCKMLCKWIHTICNLLRSTVFTQHKCLKIHPSCFINSFFPFLLSGSPWYGWICFTTYTLKDISAIPSLELLQIKWLWTLIYGFLLKHKLSFLWNKWPRVQLLDHVKYLASFEELLPFPFYITISEVWVIKFLSILTTIWWFFFEWFCNNLTVALNCIFIMAFDI